MTAPVVRQLLVISVAVSSTRIWLAEPWLPTMMGMELVVGRMAAAAARAVVREETGGSVFVMVCSK